MAGLSCNRLQISIQRGTTWPGFTIRCYEDEARTVAADLTGYLPYCDARLPSDLPASTAQFSFTLSITNGGASITFAPIAYSTTATLPLGAFQADVVLIAPDDTVQPRIATVEVDVFDISTRPTPPP